MWAADFHQVAPLCAINLMGLELTDVFRTVPKIVQIVSGILKMSAVKHSGLIFGPLYIFSLFLVTICNTVLPILSDRCLSCLAATLLYCGQMVGWIKMKLGVQVGLSQGHIVLDGKERKGRVFI